MLSLKDQKKRDRAALVAELERAGAVFRAGNAFCCPFHKKPHESNPSAAVFESDTGWRYKCHACGSAGDIFDVMALRTGRPLAEILRQTAQDAPQSTNAPRPDPQAGKKPFGSLEAIYGVMAAKHGGRLEALHEYTHADGAHNQFVIRWRGSDGQKYIWPAVKTAAGYALRFPEQRILYRLPMVSEAKTVIVVEGELKADILAEYGFPTTTSAGGSKAADRTNWRPLAGKGIIVWPDNDEAGRQYADDVKRILEGLDCRIKIIDPARLGLGHKDDAADYVRRLWDDGKSRDEIADDLRAVFSDAEPVKRTGGGASDLQAEIEAVISGEIVTVPLRWRHLSKLTKAMKPGTITLLAGNPGASKSLMLLEQFATWFDAGYASALYCLEETQTFHTRRMLAQRSGLAGLTDDDWTAANPEQARAAMQAHTGFIDAVSRRIWVCPDEMPTLADVADWIEKRCGDGFRVVCVDPITAAAHKTRETWIEDKMFLRRCEQTAKAHGASVLLVTHPVKAVALPELNTLAGSAAYGRFCQTAIWLQSHDEKESVVMTDLGRTTVTHNRTAHLLKTRNGKGQWLKLAFGFCEDTLRLKEYGTIIKH